MRQEYRGRGIAQALLADAMRRFTGRRHGRGLAGCRFGEPHRRAGSTKDGLAGRVTRASRPWRWDNLRPAVHVCRPTSCEVMDDSCRKYCEKVRTVNSEPLLRARPAPVLLPDPAKDAAICSPSAVSSALTSAGSALA